jgi:hypothetical protein
MKAVRIPSRVTRCVCEKIAQNVAQRMFVEINTLLLPWEIVAQNFCAHLVI